MDLRAPEFFINRQLSWLEFNQGVLDQAKDESVPLLERLKFLCIVSSNLDEFFEVRVAGLKQIVQAGSHDAGPDGMSATQQLSAISGRVRELVTEQYACWHRMILPQLTEKGVRFHHYPNVNPAVRDHFREYFERDPDLAPFAQSVPADGALLRVDAQQATEAEGVYAGGDVASMARFVTEAIGMGKRAALAIDRALSEKAVPVPVPEGAGENALRARLAGARLPGLGIDVQQLVPLDAIATFYYPQAPRAPEARLPVAERLGDAEVQLGLEIERALAEARRCFSCGTCISCDNCFHYCPDLAIRRLPDGGYEVDGNYCKGCGICVRECPTGSMEMIEEVK